MTDPVQDARLAGVAVHVHAGVIIVRLTLLVAAAAVLTLGVAVLIAETLAPLDLGGVPIALIGAALAAAAGFIGPIEAPFTRWVLAQLERDPR